MLTADGPVDVSNITPAPCLRSLLIAVVLIGLWRAHAFKAGAFDKHRRLGPVAHAQPPQKCGDMGLYRRLGQGQLVGDLLVGLAGADQFHDPGLLRRQLGDLLADQRWNLLPWVAVM